MVEKSNRVNLRFINPYLRSDLGHNFKHPIKIDNNLEVITCLLEHLRVIAIFQFFEYHEHLCHGVIQHVKEGIQKVLGRLVLSFQLISDSFKKQVAVSVLYSDLRV